jgi:hypothetical protein
MEDYRTNTVDGAAAYQRNFEERESVDFDYEPTEPTEPTSIEYVDCENCTCDKCLFKNECEYYLNN